MTLALMKNWRIKMKIFKGKVIDVSWNWNKISIDRDDMKDSDEIITFDTPNHLPRTFCEGLMGKRVLITMCWFKSIRIQVRK